jgi:hypothetical protein
MRDKTEVLNKDLELDLDHPFFDLEYTLLFAYNLLNDNDLLESHSKDGWVIGDSLEKGLSTIRRNPWQPIETAPKDGTKILVCDESGSECFTVSYCGFHPNAQGKKQWRDRLGHKRYPAYWQPFPKVSNE